MSAKNVFIGLAWPYANGSLHLGHASAFVGADILARYHRRKGDRVLFVSGSDCYGTPIALEALKTGRSPSEIADKYHKEFERVLARGLDFSYNEYTKTTTQIHSQIVQDVFKKLLEKDYLYLRREKMLFSPLLNRFLPDRFVEGVCPNCNYASARGDQCDRCGALLDALELIKPRISLALLTKDQVDRGDLLELEQRETDHFYLRLSRLQGRLSEWVRQSSGSWRLNARSFAMGLLAQGLRDRAITRDTNWGVSIPISGFENKKIYVWFDAVIGYLSASILWSEKHGDPSAWKAWWTDPAAIHYYVHGKDNIPFHTLIWPAILIAYGGLHLPDRIVSSEYLNLEHKQFSKSRAWAVWLPDFLRAFDGELLRYYLICYGPEKRDANFAWCEFQERVNGELIGTYGNLVNRVATLVKTHFPDGIRYSTRITENDSALIKRVVDAFAETAKFIEDTEFSQALKCVFKILEEGNRFISKKSPWKRIANAPQRDEVAQELAIMLHIFENVAILLEPFLPHSSEKVLEMLGCRGADTWAYRPPKDIYKIEDVAPLFKKITDDDISHQRSKLPS